MEHRSKGGAHTAPSGVRSCGTKAPPTRCGTGRLASMNMARWAGHLASFIAEGWHYRPDGHLMTLHQMNVTFGLHVMGNDPEAAEPEAMVLRTGGLAASLLRKLDPELHEQMRQLAPQGHRINGWRSAAGSTAQAESEAP